MSATIASKNPFDALDNDDGDLDTPKAPVKTVDKTSTHTAKRNTDGLAPVSKAPVSVNRRSGPGGNEGVLRDRNIGSELNKTRSTDPAPRGDRRGGRVRHRAGRFPRGEGDRNHLKHAPGGGSEKQAAQSWGALEGEAELKDEVAGEAIAADEHKDAAAAGETADSAQAPEAEPEPEEKSISYADYLAQQAEKKLSLAADGISVRKPNEGVKENKKWANAKPLTKDEDEDYFAPSGVKAKRERERKVKQILDIDQRYVEPERPRGGLHGSRSGGRGDFGRGRVAGGGRGDSRGGVPRGDFRGSASRGDFRGGRGGRSDAPLNINNREAFPTLGT